MTWDPARYLYFGDLRTRPAAELLARIPHQSPGFAVDLGCGPGNSTALLADRWPRAEILGLDTSEEMLDRARSDHPRLRFELGDITTWEPDKEVDVIFANAVLQWIPDHLSLLPSMMSFVSPGGSLAFQVPNNYETPAHAEGHRIVRDSFHDLDRILPDRVVFDPLEHYDALAGPGVAVDVWETVYVQPLTGDDPVADWTSGTFLRPLLNTLAADPDRRDEFLDLYRTAMRSAYPRRSGGVTLLPYPRLFAVATKIS